MDSGGILWKSLAGLWGEYCRMCTDFGTLEVFCLRFLQRRMVVSIPLSVFRRPPFPIHRSANEGEHVSNQIKYEGCIRVTLNRA